VFKSTRENYYNNSPNYSNLNKPNLKRKSISKDKSLPVIKDLYNNK